MTNERQYVVFQTRFGWVGVLASAMGLLAVTLPCSTEREALGELGDAADGAERSPARFTDLQNRLTAYYSGEKVSFPDKLDMSGVSPFQKQVWQQTSLIPCGETRSYQQIATAIGKPGAARAVGQALGRNSLLVIIPCHRVLASGGGLGGFGGGLKMKRRLLEMEGSCITGNP